MVEPRGSASKEQQRNTFKEAAHVVSVGFATWLLLWNDSASGKGDASGDLCVWIGNLERLEEIGPGVSTPLPRVTGVLVRGGVADSGRAAPLPCKKRLWLRAAGDFFAKWGAKMTVSLW